LQERICPAETVRQGMSVFARKARQNPNMVVLGLSHNELGPHGRGQNLWVV